MPATRHSGFFRRRRLFPGMSTFMASASIARTPEPLARHRRRRPGARPHRHRRRARLLQGKHKPTYTPFIDTGDHVVVVNAAKVKLTGRKEDQKIYRQHSGYEGGLREERARRRAQRQPEALVEEAVHGMLPKTKMGDAMYRKLKVRRSGSSARGAETIQARGRVTWQQQSNTTERAAARRRPPACFLRPGTGAITRQPPQVRSVLPHRSAAHADHAGRWCSPRPPTSSTSWRRSPAAACPGRPAPCGSASRARSSTTTPSCARRSRTKGS